MKYHRPLIAAMAAVTALVVMPGCAVTRDQSTVGEYVDDAGITTRVKAKFVENKTVDASSISVETLNGEVILSGFAKSMEERATAEKLASGTKGVKRVKNALEVRK
jgi:hyperosmotically inducible protein